MSNGREKRVRSQENEEVPPKFPLPRDCYALAEATYKRAENIGLLFNKFLWIWNEDWTPEAKSKQHFLKRVEALARHFPRDAYYAFLKRQVSLIESLRDQGYETVIFGKRADARILSGLGGTHPMEVGFAFHPLYGFPYLPGSGLKGVARTWAELTSQDSAEIKPMFGSESKDERQAKEHQQGDVTFLDAYAIRPPKLEVDILNPHFPDYYRDPKNNLPTEWQSPNPVNFLTIGVGSGEKDKPIFQFALTARSRETLKLAQEWLERGLEELGFGGKTASGYGYFAGGRLTVEEMNKIRDEFRREEASRPPSSQPSPSAKRTITKPPLAPPSTRVVTPKTAPPKETKPVAKPTVRQGDRLDAEVIANDGKRVIIQLLGELKQEVIFERAYYPHLPGKRVKVKVMSLTPEGKITKVSPA